MFNSQPGQTPGTTSPNSGSVAPTGVYSFTVSGLPAGNNFLEVVIVDKFDNQYYVKQGPLTNGQVSVFVPPVPNQKEPTAVYFWISSLTAPLGTIQVSNFTAKNSALYLDTSHTDSNPPTAGTFSWCWNFPGP